MIIFREGVALVYGSLGEIFLRGMRPSGYEDYY